MADEKDHRTGVVRPEDADDHATGESRFYIDPKRESRMLLKFDVRSPQQPRRLLS